MRRFLSGIIAASAVIVSVLGASTSPSRAQAYPWCLVISDKTGAWSCYFTSREQCMMSAGGNVGFCAQNPAFPSAARRRPIDR